MLNAFHTQNPYPIPVFGTGINTLQLVGSTIEAEIAHIEAAIQQALDTDQLIARISSEHPELTHDQVELIQAQLANKEWDDTITTLSETGALIVQAVVTYLTAGAGAGAGAALAEATNTALNATIQAAIDATVQSMIREATSQAITAAITGNYEFDLKGLATNALKSGVTAGISNISQGVLKHYELTGLTGDSLNLAQRAATQTALYGGDFKENLTQTLVTDIAAKSANFIGDKTDAGSLANISSHAVLGCGAAAAQGQDCASGAAGGALSATLAPLVSKAVDDGDNEFTKDEKAQIRLYTQVLSTLALSNTDLDLATADQAAQNELDNNYLNHLHDKIPEMSERERYDQASANCNNGDPMACQTRDELRQVSQQRDQALALACSTGGSQALCRTLNIEAMAMGNRVFSTEGGYVYANSPEHYDLNTSTIGPIPKNTAFEGTYQYKQAMSLQTGLQAIGPAGALKTPALFSALPAVDKNMLYGGGAGLVVDLTTQLANGGVANYNLGQTLTNVVASAGAARVGTGQSMTFNIAAQGISSYGASQVNNWTNNTNANSFQAGLDSTVGSSLGYLVGDLSNNWSPKTGKVFEITTPAIYQIIKNNNANENSSKDSQ